MITFNEIIAAGLVGLFALLLLHGIPGRAAVSAARQLPARVFKNILLAGARLEVSVSAVAYWFGALTHRARGGLSRPLRRR
jgi:hypothetical protein